MLPRPQESLARTRATRISGLCSPTCSTRTRPRPSLSWPRGCKLLLDQSWAGSVTPPQSWSSRSRIGILGIRNKNQKPKIWERLKAHGRNWNELERNTKTTSGHTLELDKRKNRMTLSTHWSQWSKKKSLSHQSYISNCNQKSKEEKVQHIVDDIHLTLSEPVYLVHIVWSNDFCV